MTSYHLQYLCCHYLLVARWKLLWHRPRRPGAGSVPVDGVRHQCARYATEAAYPRAAPPWDPCRASIRTGGSIPPCQLADMHQSIGASQINKCTKVREIADDTPAHFSRLEFIKQLFASPLAPLLDGQAF